jgi:predicted type IV restriction endonuclease
MDFIDQIKQMAERVVKMKDQILTEEATKNAFIIPFIQNLGYDVFNPMEVVSEYVADIGVKKGEKVDYAILKDNLPIILIECKHWKEDLLQHNEQLFRYFTVGKAKFGILTNGINYMFFTDLVEPNKMDAEPFLSFDITNIKENEVEELKKFHKSYFEVEAITSSASDLKYSNMIKTIFSNDLKNPSDVLVKYFISQVYPGRATEKNVSYFSELVKRSLQQAVSDLIQERLKSALTQESENTKKVKPEKDIKNENENPIVEESKIITTEEEIEAFQIIRAVLRKKLSVSRIIYRDTQSYFNILLDDNNRKSICKLYLNGTKKSIGIVDDSKKEIRYDIKNIDELFSYSEKLEKVIDLFEKQPEQKGPINSSINVNL